MENDKTSDLNLKAEFPPQSWEEWINAVQETLKGADFDKVMKTQTYEGITLNPIYRKEDLAKLKHLDCLPGKAPYIRGNNPDGYLKAAWYVAQNQDNPDLKMLNAELLDELNRGLTELNFKLHPASLSGRLPSPSDADARGIALSTLADMHVLLEGIDLSVLPIYLQSKSVSPVILALLNSYIKEKGLDLRSTEASIGFDPISEFAECGKLPFEFERIWEMMYQMVFWADMKAPKIRTICIDAPVYEHAGASSTQELAIAIAIAIGYIKGLIEKGLSIEQIAPRFQLNLSLGSNFFMEIGKIRAARLLWSEMIKAFGGSEAAQKVWIHGVSARFNKSTFDPWVNVLRTSTEAFSAVIGGVDSLDVACYDELIQTRDAFSKRIARNQQIILREEAHFDRVIDPAGGCYYIEELSSEIADKAWSIMQTIESKGGMLKALVAGEIHAMIATVANIRIDNVEKRKDVFVGVNMYANPEETPLPISNTESDWVLAALQRISNTDNGKAESIAYLHNNLNNEYLIDMITDAWMHNANLAEICSAMGMGKTNSLEIGALPERRAVQSIEEIREHVQKHTGNKSIFMFNIGKLAAIKARLDFSLGFLQVAGFNVINKGAFDNVNDAMEALALSGADSICLCALDDDYPQIVNEICERNKEKTILLAGYPSDMVETYKQMGVQIFIHLRANAAKTLSDIAQRMGVI